MTHSSIASAGLSPESLGLPPLGAASLPPAKKDSIHIIERLIQAIELDPLGRKILAAFIYDVLEDVRPRRLLSKNHQTQAIVLPVISASNANKFEVMICLIDPGDRKLRVFTTSPHNLVLSTYSSKEPRSWQDWHRMCRDTLCDMLRKQGLETCTTPQFSDIRVSELRNLDLHSLHRTNGIQERIGKYLASSFSEYRGNAQQRGMHIPSSPSQAIEHPDEELARIVTRLAHNQIKQALLSFRGSIPEYIFDPLWESEQCYIEDISRAQCALTKTMQARRARWLGSFPLFRTLAGDRKTLIRIERNEQTVEYLANQLEVRGELIKRIREIPSAFLEYMNTLPSVVKLHPGDRGLVDAVALTRALSLVNINHIPRFRGDSDATISYFFQQAVARLHETVTIRATSPLAMSAAQNLLRNAGGKWSEHGAEFTQDDVHDTRDFIQMFANRTVFAALLRLPKVVEELTTRECPPEHLRAPKLSSDTWEYDDPAAEHLAAENERISKRAAELRRFSRDLLLLGLSSKWGLGHIFRASEMWHGLVGDAPSSGVVRVWPALCEDVVAPGGIHMLPLRTSAELAEEGGAMSHCVGRGNYVGKCLLGKSHIFSVRDENGKRLSTLELGQDGRSVHVEQNRAFGNTPVKDSASNAASWLVAQINTGGIPVSWQVLAQERERLRKHSVAVHFQGFDSRDSVSWNQAFREFSRFGPGSLRGKTVEEFICALLDEVAKRNLKLAFEEEEELLAALQADLANPAIT